MTSTVLVNMGVWADVVLALVAIGIVVAGWLLAARGRAGGRRAGVLAGLSVLATLAFALAPESGATARELCFVGDPAQSLGDTANIALLFPAAFFAVIATRAPLPVLAATAALSAAIETVQAVLPVLNRSCDTNE